MNDIVRFDAVQNDVHDRNDIGEEFLFLPVEGALLQGAVLRGGALGILGFEVFEGLAKETRRGDGRITNGFALCRLRVMSDLLNCAKY